MKLSCRKKEMSLSDQLLDEIKKEESKKSKIVNVLLVLILMLFIIAGLIFILLSPEDRARLIPGFGNEPDTAEVSENELKPTEVNEKKIITSAEEQIKEQKTVLEGEPINIEEPSEKVENKKKIIKEEPIKITKTIKDIDPFTKLRQNKLSEAGTIWKKKMLSQNNRFSILSLKWIA